MCAICHPSHYTATVTLPLGVQLVAGLWLATQPHALLHTVLMARLSSVPPVSSVTSSVISILSCSSHSPSLHPHIAWTHLSHRYEGCVSSGRAESFLHLWLPRAHGGVTLWHSDYGPLQPLLVSHPDSDALSAVTYTAVTPMLNPFISRLRSRDAKRALQKELCRGARFQQQAGAWWLN